MASGSPSLRIRDKEVAAILGIGRSTLWAWAKTRPNFPQPRREGARYTYWLRHEVEAYAVGGSARVHEEAADGTQSEKRCGGTGLCGRSAGVSSEHGGAVPELARHGLAVLFEMLETLTQERRA